MGLILFKTERENALNHDFSLVSDVHEDKNAFYFDLEVPGVSEKDIQVNLDQNVLTIQGERKSETVSEDRQAYRLERSYGKFARSFALPETADAEKVDAQYKNGVLHITVAKKEVAKPKQIEVKLAS